MSELQEGYKALSSKWFSSDAFELARYKHLQREVAVSDTIKEYALNATDLEIDRAFVAGIRNEFKRNQFDNARLLILLLDNGTIIAKRFNNNQYFRL